MLRNTLLTALALLLAGCAAKGPAFTDAPPPGAKALVYIYRPYNEWMSTQDAGFDANEKRIGFLDPGGYTYFHAAPGYYEIKQFWPLGIWTVQVPELWKDLKVPVELKAGETHYLRLRVQGAYDGVSPMGGLQAHVQWVLSEVPPETGRYEIAQQKFEPQNKAMPAEFRP
jgi:hypothetical protein